MRPLFDSVKKAVYVIITSALVFIAFRNSLIWYAQRFWWASGDFWQSIFDNSHDWLGGEESEFWMFMSGSTIITLVPYWLPGLLFVILHVTQKPHFLYKYKIQETGKLELTRLKKVVFLTLTNQTLVSLPVTVVIYWLMRWRGCDFHGQLPSFTTFVWQVIVFILIEEVGFYYSHRLLHQPKLYKRIHKIHHEWTAPIGIVSLYCHPIEHIISNILPVLLGPVICGSHLAFVWVWYGSAAWATLYAHSGFHFPFLPSTELHDFHHFKFNQNYGSIGIMDRLHGTDDLFRKSKAYERHFLSLSLVPLRTMIPDDQKKT